MSQTSIARNVLSCIKVSFRPSLEFRSLYVEMNPYLVASGLAHPMSIIGNSIHTFLFPPSFTSSNETLGLFLDSRFQHCSQLSATRYVGSLLAVVVQSS
ncbi:hypothetical protein BDN70DRAFT_887768 [Pholiota conissans]|uniref:Uncharacterized protein n=1 Tax=Pholiota conissans TaxID=109636 RepID=A0A9P5YMN7_9AGAR|nr:hypothetical protein BDN70DRAFT_887768 [Pholiota conissans]